MDGQSPMIRFTWILLNWDTFFRREFAKLEIAEYQLKLIIFDVSEEVIVQWYP